MNITLEEIYEILRDCKFDRIDVLYLMDLYEKLENSQKLEILSDSEYGSLILDKLIIGLPNSKELLKKLFCDPTISNEIKLNSILTPPDAKDESSDSQSILQLILRDKLIPKLSCFLESISDQLLDQVKEKLLEYGILPLHLAIIKDDVEEVKKIIETLSAEQIKTDSSFFVLLACRNGSDNVLKEFIERGFLAKYFDGNVSYFDEDGEINGDLGQDSDLLTSDAKNMSIVYNQDETDNKKAFENCEEFSVKDDLIMRVIEFGHENIFTTLVQYLKSDQFDFTKYPIILVNTILRNNLAMVKTVIDAVDPEKIDDFITSNHEFLTPDNYFLVFALRHSSCEIVSAILDSLKKIKVDEYLLSDISIGEIEPRIFDYAITICSEDTIRLLVSKIKDKKEEVFLCENNAIEIFSAFRSDLQVAKALTDSLSEDDFRLVMLANFESILKTEPEIVEYFLSRFQDKQELVTEIMSRDIGFLHYVFDGCKSFRPDGEELMPDEYLPENEEKLLEVLRLLFQNLDTDCKRNLLQATNQEGDNLLHRAFAGGLLEICRFIIDQFKIKNQFQKTSESEQKFIYDFFTFRNTEGYTPIELAMVNIDEDKVKKMIDLFFDEFSEDLRKYFLLERFSGYNSLQLSISYLNNTLIEYFLDRFSFFNGVAKYEYLSLKDNQGNNCLHLLMKQEQSPIIKTLNILLANVGDQSNIDDYLLSLDSINLNALQLAISVLKTEDQPEVVKSLLRSHSNPNQYISVLDGNNNNCLLLTILSSENPSNNSAKIEIADFLLSNVQNKLEFVNQRNIEGINAFEYVTQSLNFEFMKLFFKHGLLKLDSDRISQQAKKFIVAISFDDSYRSYFAENRTSNDADKSFLNLVLRYFEEGSNISISSGTVTSQINKLAVCVKDNPQILETLDAIATDFLANCINQPMAGFAIITNLCEIIEAEAIFDKLEIAKRIEAMHFITSKAHEILVSQSESGSQGVQIEFGNVMLREVHKMLKDKGKINKDWQAIPQGAIFGEGSIASFNTAENLKIIYDGVVAILDQPVDQEFIQKVCGGGIVDLKKDFWALSLISKAEYSDMKASLIKAKEVWQDLGYSEEGYRDYKIICDKFDDSIVEKSIEITNYLLQSQQPSPEISGMSFLGIKRTADEALLGD